MHSTVHGLGFGVGLMVWLWFGVGMVMVWYQCGCWYGDGMDLV